MLQPVLPILSSVVANNGHWYNEKTFQETEQKNLPPRKLNKNSLTKLNMFFWHLVSTFLNLNGCIHGAFSKFMDLDLQFCRSLYGSHLEKQGDCAWYFHLILSWPTAAQQQQVYMNNTYNKKTKLFSILILVSVVTSLIWLELLIWIKIPSLPKTNISLEIPSWDPLMEKQKLKKLEFFTFHGLELLVVLTQNV